MKKNTVNEAPLQPSGLDKDASDKLIEAALPLFAMKGYAAVTVRELAEAANVNSALISYYFGGKENLYVAVLESQVAFIGRVVDRLIAAKLSPVASIQLYAKEVIAVHQQCPYLFRLLSGELISPTKCLETVVKKQIARVFAFFRQTFQEGIAWGDFRSDLEIEYAIVALAGIVNFYFMVRPLTRQMLNPSDDSDVKYVVQAINLYLNGVKNHD
jgi:TetR/AcrR family transcriptional regulator